MGEDTRFLPFTLVELLTAVMIMAILLGLLLPVLSSARMKAREVGCKSNLKQIGLGVTMYIDDHKGYTLPSNFSVGSENYSWIDYLHASDLENAGVFKCPEIPDGVCFNPYGGSAMPEIIPNPVKQASYVMNVIQPGAWAGANLTTDPTKSHGWGKDSNTPVHTARVRDPSAKIVITDCFIKPDGQTITSADARGIMRFEETDHGPVTERDVGNHHQERFNALMGDCRVVDFQDDSSGHNQWVVAN